MGVERQNQSPHKVLTVALLGRAEGQPCSASPPWPGCLRWMVPLVAERASFL